MRWGLPHRAHRYLFWGALLYFYVISLLHRFLSAGGTASPSRELLRIIARGRLGGVAAARLAAEDWVKLSLAFKGDTITATVDGVVVVNALEVQYLTFRAQIPPFGLL